MVFLPLCRLTVTQCSKNPDIESLLLCIVVDWYTSVSCKRLMRHFLVGPPRRFLQGPETDRATVRKIRDAIDNQTEVTVQLINYTKSGMLLFTCFSCPCHARVSCNFCSILLFAEMFG